MQAAPDPCSQRLREAGFTYDDRQDVWFNVTAHRALGGVAVRANTEEWLGAWLAGPERVHAVRTSRTSGAATPSRHRWIRRRAFAGTGKPARVASSVVRGQAFVFTWTSNDVGCPDADDVEGAQARRGARAAVAGGLEEAHRSVFIPRALPLRLHDANASFSSSPRNRDTRSRSPSA
jgi:hypothetical protein